MNNLGNDNRFLKREKLYDMSIGELRNYHENLCQKYKKASPKMRKSYIDQVNLVEEIIDLKTGIKTESKKKLTLHSKVRFISLIVFIVSILVIIFVSIIS